MRLLPVVLERWMLAGLLGLPATGLLAAAALGGSAGRTLVGVVVAAALLYATVTWLLLRRDLAAQLADPPLAPEDAVVEPLGLTAARIAARLLLVVALGYVAGLLDLVAIVLAIAAGAGLVAALTAAYLQAWERRAGARLVRAAARRPWDPAPPLHRL
jgi:hypothetical protein